LSTAAVLAHLHERKNSFLHARATRRLEKNCGMFFLQAAQKGRETFSPTTMPSSPLKKLEGALSHGDDLASRVALHAFFSAGQDMRSG